MMKITDKIGEGAWTLYLYECPRCRCTRKLDKGKLATVGGLTALGIGGSMFLGGPIAGWFGALGIYKLAMAGTISTTMAAQLIRENYKLLAKMSERKLFVCPACGCSDLVDMTALSVSAMQTQDTIGRKSAEFCEKIGDAMERGSVLVGEQCEKLVENVKSNGTQLVQDINRGLDKFDRQVDRGIRNLKKWWKGL